MQISPPEKNEDEFQKGNANRRRLTVLFVVSFAARQILATVLFLSLFLAEIMLNKTVWAELLLRHLGSEKLSTRTTAAAGNV